MHPKRQPLASAARAWNPITGVRQGFVMPALPFNVTTDLELDLDFADALASSGLASPLHKGEKPSAFSNVCVESEKAARQHSINTTEFYT